MKGSKSDSETEEESSDTEGEGKEKKSKKDKKKEKDVVEDDDIGPAVRIDTALSHNTLNQSSLSVAWPEPLTRNPQHCNRILTTRMPSLSVTLLSSACRAPSGSSR